MKNLNMMVKLTIGFGIVLTLMIVMSASNVLGLNDITTRGTNLDLIYQIEDATVQLKQYSDSYQIKPDNRHLDSTRQLTGQMADLSRQIQSRLQFAQNRAKAAEIPTLAEAYSRAFSDYAAAHQNKESNVERAIASGVRSDELISQLNQQINGSLEHPVLHESLSSAVAGRLSARLATDRRTLAYQARGYLLTETPEAMQRLEASYSELEQLSQQLQSNPSLSSDARISLANAIESTASYMDALRELPALVSHQSQARDTMDQAYSDLHQRTLELAGIQNQLLSEKISESRIATVVLSLIALMLATLIAWYITRQIVQPLNTAVEIAKALGNRDMTSSGVETRGDEFGTLLQALDITRSNLREALTDVNGVTTQLAAAAEELSVVTGQTSSGVNAQRVETEQVATAMNEMAATVQEVAQNSEEAAQAAQKADGQAQSGNKVLRTALEAIRHLSSDVQQSTQAMHRLNENSANISTVLTVINGIAEQTNLLALNAAIEAARAGEAGRGFAVVADEVRGLAQRTQESTAQIEDLIATLQKGAQDAVHMMDSSSQLAENTLELAHQADDELSAITRTVSEIQAMNMQIATAAEEQSSVAEEINRSVINVNTIADQSASAVEEMAASSADLARLGQSLQDLVSRFRV